MTSISGEAGDPALCAELLDAGCLKFGTFTLKSGIQSPIYFDLRVIVSYPKLLQKVAERMYQQVTKAGTKYDLLCGVPYTALPIATCISTEHGYPMLMRRKEVKKYGTKKQIEGVFEAGQRVLVVEDLVTSAMSCFETIEPLEDQGLKVSDVVVLLDREQGGEQNLANGGVNLHACFKLSTFLGHLEAAGKITVDKKEEVMKWIAEQREAAASKKRAAAEAKPKPDIRTMSYSRRAEFCSNPISAKLLQLMDSKASNLCVSADLTTCAGVLELAETVGEHIVLLKTHVDILTDYEPDFPSKLAEIAERKKFYIFEDRKFADIGNTVKNQYAKGIYSIASWAHVTNAHMVPGPGIVAGLKEAAGEGAERGLLLLAEMSSKGNLCKPEFATEALSWAAEHKDFIIGFISMRALDFFRPELLSMTPGVSLKSKGDSLGQQYKTPESVIGEKFSDMIIVGRGVYQDADPAAAAQRYRTAAWNAYKPRLTADEATKKEI